MTLVPDARARLSTSVKDSFPQHSVTLAILGLDDGDGRTAVDLKGT